MPNLLLIMSKYRPNCCANDQYSSFFVPGVTTTDAETSVVAGDGTYEDPYQGMTQDNVNNANGQNNRNFFINSGAYYAVYDPMINPDFIVLNNDQLYGRQNNFTESASGSGRPVIDFSSGGFLVPGGDSNDSFYDLQLFGDDLQGAAGIFVDHESGGAVNVSVLNSTLARFGDGIDIYNTVGSNVGLTINNSLINNNSAGGVDQLCLAGSGGYSGGVAALNEGSGAVSLYINQSTVSNNSNGAGVSNWGGIGMFNAGPGALGLTVNYSKIGSNSGDGLSVLNSGSSAASTVTVNGSNVTNNGENGIDALNKDNSGNMTFKITNSKVTAIPMTELT